MSNLFFQRFIFVIVFINPSYLLACSCVNNDLDTQISKTPYIFTGIVMKEEIKDYPALKPDVVVEYTIHLTKNYKGISKDKFKLYSVQAPSGGNCNISLTVGLEFLLFAFETTEEDLYITGCSPNIDIREGQDLIKQLENINYDKS